MIAKNTVTSNDDQMLGYIVYNFLEVPMKGIKIASTFLKECKGKFFFKRLVKKNFDRKYHLNFGADENRSLKILNNYDQGNSFVN